MRSNGVVVTDIQYERPEEVSAMGDGVLMHMRTMNTTKPMRMGWTGFADSIEGIFEMSHDNADMGSISEMVVDGARPLI